MIRKSLLPSNKDNQNENLKTLIARCELQSEVDLTKLGLTDEQIPVVVNFAIIGRQCVELWLKYNSITSQGASILANALQHAEKLRELYLYGNHISDQGAYFLARALSVNHSSLTRLSIGANGITDEGAHYIADMLKVNGMLKHLLLSANKIKDKGCLYLVNALIYHNGTLERIDLDSNPEITDASGKNLTAMIQINDNLIGLNVSGCTLANSSKAQLQRVATVKEYFQLWV